MSGENDSVTDVDIALGDKSSSLVKKIAGFSANVQEVGNIVAINAGSSIISFFKILPLVLKEVNALETFNKQADEKLKQFNAAASVACSIGFSLWWIANTSKKYNQSVKTLGKEEAVKKVGNKLDDVKNQLNPWYGNFRTCAPLGNTFGQVLVEFLFLIPGLNAVAGKFKKPIKTCISSVLGLLFGTLGACLLAGGGDIRNLLDSTLFHIGKDGWRRYAKFGLSVGGLYGGAIGALLTHFGSLSGGMLLNIGFGAGIGGLIGFFSSLVIVPIGNYLISHFFGTDPTKTIDQNSNRTKYMRSGLALGANLGTIIGFILGMFIPFPGATLLFMTVLPAIFGTIGAATLGLLGPKFAWWINKFDELCTSSLDFGMASGAVLLQSLGNAIGGIVALCGIAIAKLTELITAMGGFLGAILGGAYDCLQNTLAQAKIDKIEKDSRASFKRNLETYLNQHPEIANEKNSDKKNKLLAIAEQTAVDAAKEEAKMEFNKNKRPLLPWSQRVSIFTPYGSMLGGAADSAIGENLGSGIGGFIAGVISIFWGAQIYEKIVHLGEWLSNTFSETPLPVTPPTSPPASQRSSLSLPSTTTLSAKLNSQTPPAESQAPFKLPPPPPPPPPSRTLLLAAPFHLRFAGKTVKLNRNGANPNILSTSTNSIAVKV